MASATSSPGAEVLFSTTARDNSISRLAAFAVATGFSFAFFILSIGFAPVAFAVVLGIAFFASIAGLAWSERRTRAGTRIEIVRGPARRELVVPSTKIALTFPLQLEGAKRVDGSTYSVVIVATDPSHRKLAFGASDLPVEGLHDPWFDGAGHAEAANDARFVLNDIAAVTDLRRAIERTNAGS